MKPTRKLALAGVGLAAVIGAGAALAATSHGKQAVSRGAGTFVSARHGPIGPMHRGDHLAAAASYLGLTTTELQADLRSGKTLAQVADATTGKSAAGLVAALVAHEQDELAAAVKAGTLTQAQADAISASLQQRIARMVDGTMPMLRGGPGFGRGPGGDLGAAADYLGITESALATDLRSGKTLAQVADATTGKSAAGLVAALVAQEKQELAAAVTAGRLTQAQADALSANLEQRVTDLANGVHPVGPMPRMGGGMGGGMGGMHGGWGPNA